MIRLFARFLLLISTSAPVCAFAQADALRLALGSAESAQYWRIDRDGRVQQQGKLPDHLTTPLGSLWKLFVFDYLVSEQVAEIPYTCTGQNRDEVYCCDPGQQIRRDQALVKSCGLYFSPARLGITPAIWSRRWPASRSPSWLQGLERLQPDTQVNVHELLQMLAILPAQAEARRILLDRLLLETPVPMDQPAAMGPATSGGAPLAGTLGTRLRVKTWSWHVPGVSDQRVGGFAGWLSNGVPVWASAAGTSQQVLERYAAALDAVLNTVWSASSASDPQPCVDVTLFDRYPVKAVHDERGNLWSTVGPLMGRYTVSFYNGNTTSVESRGELILTRPVSVGAAAGTPSPLQLHARLAREEYVARVLDREAAATPGEAAKALAVAARTYLLQNGARQGVCLQINDSSHHQRVSPRPASLASRHIAEWTADLVLAGATVTYHQTDSGPSRLSWLQAKQQAAQGWRYDAILAAAFPRANLARWDNPQVTCQALPLAEQWLHQQLPRWRERLDPEPGYVETRNFTVCRLLAGKPHIDRLRRQIHVRNLQTLQDRLDLTHEYLHLAFEAHPNGQDEAFVESLARHLLLE